VLSTSHIRRVRKPEPVVGLATSWCRFLRCETGGTMPATSRRPTHVTAVLNKRHRNKQSLEHPCIASRYYGRSTTQVSPVHGAKQVYEANILIQVCNQSSGPWFCSLYARAHTHTHKTMIRMYIARIRGRSVVRRHEASLLGPIRLGIATILCRRNNTASFPQAATTFERGSLDQCRHLQAATTTGAGLGFGCCRNDIFGYRSR
jgi:hypothetical protein